LLIASLTIGGHVMADEGAPPPKGASVALAVHVSGPSVVATLVFENHSDGDVYLDRRNACAAGVIENDVFEIRAGRRRVSYLGALAKRRPPTPDDFIRLGAGQTFTTEVKLERAYGFLKGRHEYEARYVAIHQYPSRPLLELQSNPERFSFRK